jgi:hypothetical protein
LSSKNFIILTNSPSHKACKREKWYSNTKPTAAKQLRNRAAQQKHRERKKTAQNRGNINH